MENIVVTGGAGFIGSNLIKALVKRYPKAKIISVDNYFTGKKENHVVHPNVKYIYGTTTHMLGIVDLLTIDPDVVFHLGEYSRIVKSFEDIVQCHRFNIDGTFGVLLYCRQKKCKLVYAASSSKFGNEGADQHLSPYAWMKAKNVEFIRNFKDWYGEPSYAITYFYNVYGPGQIMSGDYAAVIGIFQHQVLNNQKITVVSPGEQKRDFTHVDDIVEGMILAAEKGDGDGYLLGTGTNHTLKEIAEAFDHPWEFIPERKGERFTSQAYPTKAREELGWEPKRDVIEYIKEWKRVLKGE